MTLRNSLRKYLLCLSLLILFIGCTITTTNVVKREKWNKVFQNSLTQDQIELLEKNYKKNPAQYSQAMGEYILTKMYRKCPEFGSEFAQVPELNDGISPEEVEALIKIYKVLEPILIPPNLLEHKEIEDGVTYTIHLEWSGEGDFSGKFLQLGHIGKPQGIYSTGIVLDAKPLGFEDGDKIDKEYLATENNLRWESKVSGTDVDGIEVTVKIFPKHEKFMIFFRKGSFITFKPEELSAGLLVYGQEEKLTGSLNIKLPTPPDVASSEVNGLMQMVRAGEGDHKFSAPLQALLWGYLDGYFPENYTPFVRYPGHLEFVKPIWGSMDSVRWKNYDEVTKRLNYPQLLHYYINSKMKYICIRHTHHSPTEVFEQKWGDCDDLAEFGEYILKKAGYKTFLNEMYSEAGGHFISGILLSDGRYQIIIDFGPSGNKMHQPSKSVPGWSFPSYRFYH